MRKEEKNIPENDKYTVDTFISNPNVLDLKTKEFFQESLLKLYSLLKECEKGKKLG